MRRWPEEDNTWEGEEALEGCDRILDEWRSKQAERALAAADLKASGAAPASKALEAAPSKASGAAPASTAPEAAPAAASTEGASDSGASFERSTRRAVGAKPEDAPKGADLPRLPRAADKSTNEPLMRKRGCLMRKRGCQSSLQRSGCQSRLQSSL